jgi:hypothetical protein
MEFYKEKHSYTKEIIQEVDNPRVYAQFRVVPNAYMFEIRGFHSLINDRIAEYCGPYIDTRIETCKFADT